MTGFLGFVYRFVLFVLATYNAIVTIGFLDKATNEKHSDSLVPFAVGAILSIFFYFMLLRSRKRAKQFKQKHNIANEDRASVEQEDSDDDVSYSQPESQRNFDPKNGTYY